MPASHIRAEATWLLLAFSSLLAGACSSSNGSGAPVTNTGQTCAVATDCYADVDTGAVQGDIECLTKVPNGYCTHTCVSDANCCAAPGECPGSLAEVCAPFESTGQMQCFVACENAELAASGFTDGDAFCQRYASAAFTCRSTGGGSQNRKVCVPSG